MASKRLGSSSRMAAMMVPQPGPSAPPPGAPPGMKKGGGVKKMAKGGYTSAADGVAQSGKTKGKQITMKSGGRC